MILYYQVNKHRYVMRAHSLVWITFNGMIRDPTLQINHIDGVKTNNAISNLELITPGENTRHAVENNLMLAGERNPHSRLTNQRVADLRAEYERNILVSITDLANSYGVSESTIARILRGGVYKQNYTCRKHIRLIGRSRPHVK